MSAPTSPAAQQRSKRTRKSIAHFPSGENLSSHENGIYGFGKDTAANKKSRSKSLGPGGLEALREGSGNRQKALPAIRSILKPTIPLSPPKAIPPRTPRMESPGRSKARASVGRPVEEPPHASPRALENALFPGTGRAEKAEVVALRTEEEQQREARQRERQEVIRRRDERRKSLANRRVSFAPEATLHTWDVVELNEDATTSSEATNSTRRQSSGNTLTSNFTQGTQHAPNPEMDPPSTPPVQDEQASSPEHQRDIHQKKRRRSSTIPPINSSNPDPLSSSPTSSMADDVTQQSFVSGIGEDDNEDDVSDTDTYRDDESTAMDIDEDDEVDVDSTSRSVGSGQADDTASSSSSGQLDARLRQAVEQASTQNLDLPDLDQIRRNENLIEADFEADQQAGEEEDEGMDMTEAVGGILQNQPSSPFETLLVEQSPQRRSSRIARRRSSGANTTAEDETMELTTAIGHIRRASTSSRRESGATVATEDEDMSMELTNVIGGVIGSVANEVEPDDDEGHDFQPDLTAQMDMTTVYGRILSPVTERTEPSTEASETMDFTTAVGAIQPSHTQAEQEPEDATATMTMDVTKAIGSILPDDLRSSDRMTGRMLMKEETEHGQLLRSSLIREPSYPTLPPAESLNAPEPLVRIHTTTPPQSPEANTTTPRSEGRQMTPTRGTATPTHQATPQPAPRPTTPSKTPPNRNIAMRRTSPRKLFSQSTKERPVSVASPASSTSTKRRRRATIETEKPPVTDTTQTLNPAKIGIERTGLGSPTVAELLDRRTSIGESASTFTPQGPASRGVRFQDPQEIERVVDQERTNELHRESGRDALEREADIQQSDKDVTANLRDMIQSMTPKKKKDFKGRKSLAVGSALGLLGKRPVELDQEDEDDSPKRLKGPEHSPVKSIRLPAPPSKAETTGRLGKLGRVSLGPVSGNVGTPRSSEKSQAKATTPKDQARFRDAGMNENTVPPVSFNQRDRGISPELQQEDDDEEEDGPIQLQDFLNMINVRFMDLETSKRRHTILPQGRSSSSSATDERRLVDCVAASVSTVPMLELYQHSCRELKKYISEGRNIVREIEQDTYDDNPALFREYISAAPDMRAIMDNQFKNVKSHARLLSKAMWYEWRMKLLEGLRDGLVRIGDGLADDGKSLSKQEELLNSTVPPLVSEHQQLVEKEARLRQHAEELASCDQEELKGAREKLRNADAELIEKRKLLAELQAQKSAQDVKLTKLTERKQQCLAEIETSRRLNDEYRGWKPAEVAALKAEVDAFEKSSGWTITNASSDERLEMSYRGIISLAFKPTSFQPASANPDLIEVSLTGDKNIISTEREFHDDETKSAAATTQQQFFLDLLRRRFTSLDQSATKAQDVLRFVARTWALADGLHGGVSDLALGYVTDVDVVNPDCIAVTANVLLRNMRTRVRARFEVTVGGKGTLLEVNTSTTAAVVYGEELKEGNMADFLAKKIVVDKTIRTVDRADNGGEDDEGAEFTRWANAVRELETRLIARGKK